MAKDLTFTISKNVRLARDTYRLVLSGDTSSFHSPGQFVNIEVPGFYLRRPLSVADWSPGELHLIYKILGQGTQEMTQLTAGMETKVLTGLGNGFSLQEAESPLIVGGGVGVVPLYALARKLVAHGQKPQVVLGFNSADEVFLVDDIAALGLDVTITTADGSAGVPGFVTDGLPETFDYFYSCGPTPMLRALAQATTTPGEFSLEERMACGFGACMGCVTETISGNKRVCKEGPVFTRKELGW